MGPGLRENASDLKAKARVATRDDHYLAVQAGWDGQRRVQGAFLHLDIIGEKVWIQFNGTDQSVAAELVAAGVAKEDIVLGDKSARVRPHTGYGVG